MKSAFLVGISENQSENRAFLRPTEETEIVGSNPTLSANDLGKKSPQKCGFFCATYKSSEENLVTFASQQIPLFFAPNGL